MAGDEVKRFSYMAEAGGLPEGALQPEALDFQLPMERRGKVWAKAHRREKGVRPMVSPLHLSCMVAAYDHHFAVYSQGRKQVNQLIPSVVWKAIYSHYLEQFPESLFQEESLKDRLRERLKELKNQGATPDEENSRTAVLPRDCEAPVNVVENVLKRSRQSLIDGAAAAPGLGSSGTTRSIEIAVPPLPNPNLHFPNPSPHLPNPSPHCINSVPNPSPNPPNPSPHFINYVPNPSPNPPNPSPSTSAPFEKMMSKSHMLQELFTSIALLARSFEASSEKREALLAAKLDTEAEKRKKVKICNLKSARDLGVVSEEEFKQQVKEILNL